MQKFIITVLLVFNCVHALATDNLKWAKGGYSSYGGEVRHFALSPDGKYFAASNYGGILIYDAMTGNVVKSYFNDYKLGTKLLFTPDNKLLDLSSDPNVLWNLDTDTAEYEFANYKDGNKEFYVGTYSELSGDGKLLAAVGNWTDNKDKVQIVIWDFKEQKRITTIKRDYDWSSILYLDDDIEFSPDNKRLVIYDDDISLWDTQTGELVKSEPATLFKFIKYTNDGKYIGGINKEHKNGRKFFIEIRNASDLSFVKRFEMYDTPLFETNFSFSYDSKYVAFRSTEGNRVEVRDIETGALVNKFRTHGFTSPDCLFFMPDNKSIIAAQLKDGFSEKLDFRTGKLETSLSVAGSRCHRLIFSPDNKYLAMYTADGYLKVMDAATGSVVKFSGTGLNILGNGAQAGATIVFSPGSDKILMNSDDEDIFIWDLMKDERLVLEAHTDTVHSVAFSPDGKYFASASEDKSIIIWDAATNTIVKRLNHTRIPMAITFSADSKKIIAIAVSETDMYDLQQVVWDIDKETYDETTMPSYDISLHRNSPVSFSYDGKYFAKCNYIWDVEKKEVAFYYGGGCIDVVLSNNGDYLAELPFSEPDTHEFDIIEIPSGEVVRHYNIFDEVKYTRHKAWDEISESFPRKVAITNDNKFVAMASEDGLLYLWKFLDGTGTDETLVNVQTQKTGVYPNPASDLVTLQYELPESGMVQIRLFDALSNDLGIVFNEYQEAGINSVSLDLQKIKSGVYFYRIQINNSFQSVPFLVTN